MQDLLLQIEILWPAFLAGLLVLATHIPFGQEVLQRGIIFLDLAVAQIAAFGVVVANTFWLGDHIDQSFSQTLVAIVAAIIGSMGLYCLRNLETRIQEAIIGIMFILAATGSILLLATDPHGNERLKEILVGQILWIQPSQLISLAILYSMVLGLWLGLKAKLGNWIFYPLFAITITLSTQVVGVYLVFASLIIPCLATLNQNKPLFRSYCIGAIGYFTGLVVSALFDLPAGATIVWSLTIMAALYFGAATIVSGKSEMGETSQ